MRKICLFIATSLDGYIARNSGEIDWLFTDQDYGYSEFFAQIDTVIMGRKTYEQVLSFGEYPYAGKQSFVFSKTLQGKSSLAKEASAKQCYVEFVGANLVDFITTLRQSDGRDIWLVGGSEIVHFFMQNNFVDELIISIHPIVLGSGIPLFSHDLHFETLLELKQVKAFDSGLVQIAYHTKLN
jgi:dihydrofolate reductase